MAGRFCRAIYVALTIGGDAAPDISENGPMRITGPNGTTLGSQAGSVRRTGSGGFSLPDAAAPPETRAASTPKATAGIDALLAMQGIEEDPLERRKRSVHRGRRALDVLDDLKIGLLSGTFDASTVSRLRDAAANLKSSSGDPGLDTVLSEIELRVEVELAKAGQF
jgi:Class II flagellar assembly regulator